MSDILQYLIDKKKKESFTEGYQATDEEALGLILASYFDYGGQDILKALGYALEDANFHSENAVIQEMIEKLDIPEISNVHNGKKYITIACFRSARSGEIYTVKGVDNGEKVEHSCDCKGWIFRRTCKHIKYMREKLMGWEARVSINNPIEL